MADICIGWMILGVRSESQTLPLVAGIASVKRFGLGAQEPESIVLSNIERC